MDKKHVENLENENKRYFENKKNRIRKEVFEYKKLDPDDKREILSLIDSLQYNDEILHSKLAELNDLFIVASVYDEDIDNWCKKIEYEKLVNFYNFDFNVYLDSEPMFFDGDIIITDPCYIIRCEHHGTKPLTDDDWYACNYGSNMETLGIKKYMTRDTLYGNWCCTTFNSDTGERIGKFCADAGLVSVFDLSEVLAYNPDFDYHTERKWTTTLIENFKGTVQFVVIRKEGVYKNTTPYHKEGEKWEDYQVQVIGHGINKITGGNINFIGKQTWF